MSYENVRNKVNKLEDLGYLNRGDSSVEYMTMNPFIISRFVNRGMSQEGEKYFRQKLTEFLIEEEVLFEFIYSLLVLPSYALSRTINGANSYSEMALKLEKLNYVRIFSVTDDRVRFGFTSNGHDLYLSAQSLQHILDDGIEAKNADNGGIEITSDRCNSAGEKKQIDLLFD